MQYGDFVKNKQSILYPCIPGLKSCLHTRTQNAKQIQALLLFIENLTTCFTFCILHTTCLSPTDVNLLSALPNLWVKIQALLRLEVHYSACRISTSRHHFSQASRASWCQDCCLKWHHVPSTCATCPADQYTLITCTRWFHCLRSFFSWLAKKWLVRRVLYWFSTFSFESCAPKLEILQEYIYPHVYLSICSWLFLPQPS